MRGEGRLGTTESSSSDRVIAPVVSVMIMVYNHERYLAEAISSVLEQDVDFPMEVLIGEDCSSDRSRQIALDFERRYPSVVRLITSEENVGAFQNYRRLLSAARGEFVAHLDGDDYWLPGKLRQQVEALRLLPTFSAVYANAKVVNRCGNDIGRFNHVGDAELSLSDMLQAGNFLHTSSMLFRGSLKGAILSLGDEFIDFRLHLELAKYGSLRQLSAFLSAYRVNTESSMVANDNTKVRELYWQAVLSVDRSKVTDREYCLGIADFLRRVLFRSIAVRNFKLFAGWWKRASEDLPCDSWRLAWFLVTRSLRVGGLLVIDRLRSWPRHAGRTDRVLYHR